jgi:hypothetical protein
MSCACSNASNSGNPSTPLAATGDYSGTGTGSGRVCNRCLLFWLILFGVAFLVLQERREK